MHRSGSSAWTVLASIAVGVLVLDQATKSLIAQWIGSGNPDNRQELAGRLLAVEYVENTGAAFGILAGQTWALAVAAVVVSLLFAFVLRRDVQRHRDMAIAVGLILGGGLGNLIDRIRLGYVVDFIAVGSWPKFNTADSAITAGLVVLAVGLMREPHPTPTHDNQRIATGDANEGPTLGT